MGKKGTAIRRAEGSVYVGVWLEANDAKSVEVLKKSYGIEENAPLLRRLIRDAIGEGPPLEAKKK